MSIFIPCLNGYEATKEILRVTKRLRLNVVTRIVIEDGVRGCGSGESKLY